MSRVWSWSTTGMKSIIEPFLWSCLPSALMMSESRSKLRARKELRSIPNLVDMDLSLPLNDYRRYGRQMILDGFGLPGQESGPCLNITLRWPDSSSEAQRCVSCGSRSRRPWMSCSPIPLRGWRWRAIQQHSLRHRTYLDQAESA